MKRIHLRFHLLAGIFFLLLAGILLFFYIRATVGWKVTGRSPRTRTVITMYSICATLEGPSPSGTYNEYQSGE